MVDPFNTKISIEKVYEKIIALNLYDNSSVYPTEQM
jgi:hypothetical protein